MVNDNEMLRNSFDGILKYGLLFDADSLFESLKHKGEFQEPNPLIEMTAQIEDIEKPINTCDPEPKLEHFPPSRLLELKLKFEKNEELAQSIADEIARNTNEKFQQAYIVWQTKIRNYESDLNAYNASVNELQMMIPGKINAWKERKEAFYIFQNSVNQPLDNLKKSYSENCPGSISKYLETILGAVRYPGDIVNSFEIEYSSENKSLIVDVSLPNSNQTPQSAETLQSNGELKTKELSLANKKKIYESTVYQIVFRVLYSLFTADFKKHVDAITLNGWVIAINKSTGKLNTCCIASIHITRNDFDNLDLNYIDPKICFKSFRGICATDLTAMTAIPPIVTTSKVDRRFVESKQIIESVKSGTNLAAMAWEDFEHLIREIFESEFKSNGGEVKVTQASRDGGVDAIAFDPDIIRGGKIIIQAKRYTNTVSVSAVRDLYGTILNEGATKGVLVTTSDFGPDSYEFAKGKPISLLNGSNLLYLLEKHGYKARIDIKEAKLLAKLSGE